MRIPTRLSIALSLTILAAVAGQAGAQEFLGSQIPLPPSSSPMDMAVADLNNDGLPDFVEVGENAAAMNVALSSSGKYAAHVSYVLPDKSPAVAVGDIDNDGDLDAVAAIPAQKSVAILRQTSGGAFGAATPVVVGPNPSDPSMLTMGDVNSDGSADLVGVMANSSQIALALADGSGGLLPFQFLGSGPFPQRPRFGDLDGDSDLDLIVPSAQSSSWSIYFGDGFGTLVPGAPIGAGDIPTAVTYIDSNADGNIDIAGVNTGFAFQYPGSITLRLGDGAGGFPSATTFSTLQTPNYIQSGDVNADGKTDLTTSHGTSGFVNIHSVLVMLATGPTTFVGHHTMTGLTNPGVNALFDHTGDGTVDMAILNRGGLGIVLVAGDGTGKFPLPTNFSLNTLILSVSSGDLDADGIVDLVSVSGVGPPVQSYKGLGNGGFTPGPLSTLPHIGNFGALGDFDNDAILDLAIAGSQGDQFSGQGYLEYMKGNGNLTFAPAVSQAGGQHLYSLALGDLNADGNLDVAAAGLQNPLGGKLRVFLGTGLGAPQLSTTQYNLGITPRSPVIADFTLDGVLDVATADGDSNQLSILTGTGTGLLLTAVSIPAGTAPVLLVAADVNRDGKTDLLRTNIGLPAVTLMTHQGGLAFQDAPIPLLSQVSALRFADVTADGFEDAVVGHNASGFEVLTGNGMGALTPSNAYFGTAAGLLTADLNSDGRQDVFTHALAFSGASATSFLNQGQVPGTTYFGTGTPGCQGILGIAASSAPKIGNAQFAILGTNAPKYSLGLTLVTDVAIVSGSDPFGLGEVLYTDLVNSLEILGFNAYSDGAGSAITPAGVPNIPALVGKTYYAQMSFIEAPGLACGSALFNLVTGRCLAITIMP